MYLANEASEDDDDYGNEGGTKAQDAYYTAD